MDIQQFCGFRYSDLFSVSSTKAKRNMFLLKECLVLPFSTTSFKEIHIFDLDGSITNNWQHLFPVKADSIHPRLIVSTNISRGSSSKHLGT